MSKTNPYITPGNPYAELNASQENLKNRPEALEMSKLCYTVFYSNRDGKVLLDKLNEHYLMSRIVPTGSGNYDHECIKAEGMREVIHRFNDLIESHKKHIRSEVNK